MKYLKLLSVPMLCACALGSAQAAPTGVPTTGTQISGTPTSAMPSPAASTPSATSSASTGSTASTGTSSSAPAAPANESVTLAPSNQTSGSTSIAGNGTVAPAGTLAPGVTTAILGGTGETIIGANGERLAATETVSTTTLAAPMVTTPEPELTPAEQAAERRILAKTARKQQLMHSIAPRTNNDKTDQMADDPISPALR